MNTVMKTVICRFAQNRDENRDEICRFAQNRDENRDEFPPQITVM